MDNDSTTIAIVRATVDPDTSITSDSNYTKKGSTSSLVNLSTSHKVLKNLKVRSHIESCFTYCVKQAKGFTDQLSGSSPVW